MSSRSGLPAREDGDPTLDLVFGALSDPTRRQMLTQLLSEGSTSVPRLTAELPITRQAVAKHLAALDKAGLIERTPGAGREVRYQLRQDALRPAAAWVAQADRAWERRLERLKTTLEQAHVATGPRPTGAARGDGSAVGGDGSAVPGDGSAVPGDGSAVPGDGSAVPGDGSAVGGDGSAVGGDGSVFPGDRSAVPGDRVQRPAPVRDPRR